MKEIKHNALYTGRKLNVHETLRKRPGRMYHGGWGSMIKNKQNKQNIKKLH